MEHTQDIILVCQTWRIPASTKTSKKW